MQIFENLLRDLKSRPNRVDHAVQMLDSLLCFITLNQIQSVKSRLTLTLASNCKHEAIICNIFFTSKESTIFHNLYHISILCVPHMNWLFIVYHRDIRTAFDEIFLWLLQTICNDPSVSASTNLDILLWVINESEDPVLQVLAIKSISSPAEICHGRRNRDVISGLVSKQLGTYEQRSSVDWWLIMCYLDMINADIKEAIWNKSVS